MNVRDPRPAEKIGKYLGRGKISNFAITTQTSFVDFLISTLTLGIYSTRTVKYEGDVVQ